MTITCIDSSALLCLCFTEGDVTLVHRALANGPTISVLSAVEVVCAIHARAHRGQLSGDEHDRLLVVAGRLVADSASVRLTVPVQREAVAIAERFLLRASDAIHVATAVLLARRQRRHGILVRFCTADLRQAQAAVALLGVARVDTVPPHMPRTRSGAPPGCDTVHGTVVDDRHADAHQVRRAPWL